MPRIDPPPPRSGGEAAIVERFIRAFVSDDIEELIALLTEEVVLNMPPLPFEWHGRDAVRGVLAALLEPGRRLVATRANRQPAFGLYLPDSDGGVLRPIALLVLTLSGQSVAMMTRFELASTTHFGLPATLPA
jgi:hypothetical protein